MMPVAVVTFQNTQFGAAGFLLLMQAINLTMLLHYLIFAKFKVFDSLIDLLSHFNFVIILFLFGLIGFWLDKWYSTDYIVQNGLSFAFKLIPESVSYTIIALILLSVLLEISKSVQELVKSVTSICRKGQNSEKMTKNGDKIKNYKINNNLVSERASINKQPSSRRLGKTSKLKPLN